jgi:hypothetical protein
MYHICLFVNSLSINATTDKQLKLPPGRVGADIKQRQQVNILTSSDTVEQIIEHVEVALASVRTQMCTNLLTTFTFASICPPIIVYIKITAKLNSDILSDKFCL